MSERKIANIIEGAETSDGAGVRLKRIIDQGVMKETDPFLLLDFFGSNDPDEYIAWRGPIVMNTEEELDMAFRELQGDNFMQ